MSSENGSSWVQGVAIALVAAMLLPFVWVAPPVLRVVAAAFALALAAVALRALVGRRKRDPYDLRELRRLQEEEELERIRSEEPAVTTDQVLCRTCGACYSEDLSRCPECGSGP